MMILPKSPLILPRTESAFQLIADLASTNPELPDWNTRLEWSCPIAEHDHSESFRQFAHTMHHHHTVCVAGDIGRLPDEYLLGIMAHEFGHLIAVDLYDDKSEEGADWASEKYLGLPILYGSELDLEYLDENSMKQLMEFSKARGIKNPPSVSPR